MKKLGIIVLIIGLLTLAYSAVNHFGKTTTNNTSELKMSAIDTEDLQWSPIIGISVLIIRSGMYVFGSGKKEKTSYKTYRANQPRNSN